MKEEEELRRRGTRPAEAPLSEEELASAEYRAEEYDDIAEMYFSGDWELDVVNPSHLQDLLFGPSNPESIALRIRVLNGFNLLPRLLREVRASRASLGGMTADEAQAARSRRLVAALRDDDRHMRIVK